MLKKYTPHFIFIGIIGLFVLTRLWRLNTLPSGLHIDEASMAYSAWCLAEHGVDRYLDSWPIYLKNFGGGQSALYAYLCAFLFRIFGYHQILIRIPAVIFSFLNLICGMKLSKKLYPSSTYLPLLTGFLIVICPYFIMAGRLGLDCNLMLGMSTAFLLSFICAISSNKIHYYIFAGLTGGLVLYTYALSYIIVPLFLILSLLYVIRLKRFSLKGWISMAIPMGILAFPLILEQLVNAFNLPELRLGVFTITKMESYRASEIGFFRWDNLLRAIKSIFIGDEWAYNSVPGTPPLYAITNALFVLGLCSVLIKLFRSIQKREFDPISFIFLWFLSVFFFECHISSNVNKINSIFLVTLLIAMDGFLLFSRVKGLLSRIIPSVLIAGYLICFILFGNYYYTGRYTQDYYPLPYFDITVTEAINYIESHPQIQHKGTYMAEADVFLALSTRLSPYELLIFEPENPYFSYYRCGILGEIEEGYNYIVRDIFVEYANELRARGYTEIQYVGYSLFYQE